MVAASGVKTAVMTEGRAAHGIFSYHVGWVMIPLVCALYVDGLSSQRDQQEAQIIPSYLGQNAVIMCVIH